MKGKLSLKLKLRLTLKFHKKPSEKVFSTKFLVKLETQQLTQVPKKSQHSKKRKRKNLRKFKM